MYITLKLKVIAEDPVKAVLGSTIAQFTESFNRVCTLAGDNPELTELSYTTRLITMNVIKLACHRNLWFPLG